MEQESIILDPASLETPQQRGITERAGKTFRRCLQRPYTTLPVLAGRRGTKQWLRVERNYQQADQPIWLQPMPESLWLLMTGGANDHGVASRYEMGDLEVQKAIRIRQAAAVAFHQSDCNQAFRNALSNMEEGEHTSMSQDKPYIFGERGCKKNNSSFWRGPAKVILTNLPSTVWVSFQGYVVKASPEHLRVAFCEEKMTLTGWIDDIAETRKRLEDQPQKGYIVLDELPPEAERVPEPEPLAPKRYIHGKTPPSQIEFQPVEKRIRLQQDCQESRSDQPEPGANDPSGGARRPRTFQKLG